MRNVSYLLLCTTLLLYTICKADNKTDFHGTVSLTMEGETHILDDLDAIHCKASFENGKIQYLFRKDGNPVSLNLNFTTQAILEKGSAVFEIPDANAGKVVIDLNFFNQDRDSSRTNKRIIFRKGTIRIEQLTRHHLEMSFEGEGGGMTERSKSFPITGKI
jgi:hypothetical protein